ncbi:hypothetical protein BaRGS_00036581 [Batillaria attramentaria]|uniref:Uncharacterized protein n=1 Tax=Batillaria attramentaria TaxID=370345 RepID=A0ABD0JCP2_9CAEN
MCTGFPVRAQSRHHRPPCATRGFQHHSSYECFHRSSAHLSLPVSTRYCTWTHNLELVDVTTADVDLTTVKDTRRPATGQTSSTSRVSQTRG